MWGFYWNMRTWFNTIFNTLLVWVYLCFEMLCSVFSFWLARKIWLILPRWGGARGGDMWHRKGSKRQSRFLLSLCERDTNKIFCGSQSWWSGSSASWALCWSCWITRRSVLPLPTRWPPSGTFWTPCSCQVRSKVSGGGVHDLLLCCYFFDLKSVSFGRSQCSFGQRQSIYVHLVLLNGATFFKKTALVQYCVLHLHTCTLDMES